MGSWSTTGEPVVPKNETHLRQQHMWWVDAQALGLRWVIRPAAKSAEAWLIHG